MDVELATPLEARYFAMLNTLGVRTFRLWPQVIQRVFMRGKRPMDAALESVPVKAVISWKPLQPTDFCFHSKATLKKISRR